MRRSVCFLTAMVLFLVISASAQTKSESHWRVGNYVDDFGEPTSEKYVTNKGLIRGKFSNTATTNSCLTTKFLIDKSAVPIHSELLPGEEFVQICIQLREYCSNHPVKNYGQGTKYIVKVKSNEGETLKLTATNYSDRLQFDGSSDALHRTLTAATTLKFYIYESDTPTTEYRFSVNAIGYSAAYKELNPN